MYKPNKIIKADKALAVLFVNKIAGILGVTKRGSSRRVEKEFAKFELLLNSLKVLILS